MLEKNLSFDETRDIFIMILISQLCFLDFAFREFEKKKDEVSQRKFEDIWECLKNYDIKTRGVCYRIPQLVR